MRNLGKVKWLVVFVVGLTVFLSSICPASERLANRNLEGIHARSLKQVLRTKPSEIDIATAVLIASEQWSNIVEGRRYLKKLDQMSREIIEKLEQRRIGRNRRAIKIISEYLFEEQGYQTVKKADNPEDLFLHSVMDNKRGYCLSLSVLYMGIGERLGLPIYGVVVPGHFFVRYDNGKVQFNIETTSNGAIVPDEYYIEKFDVPHKSGTIYMTNLSKLETLGCFFNNLGNAYISVGDNRKALQVLEQAVSINPQLAESRVNLGNVYLKNGKIKDAIYEYTNALEINPLDASIHNNLGNAYSKGGWLYDAICEYQRAMELDPNTPEVYQNLASIYSKQNNLKKALGVLLKGLKRNELNANMHVQLGDIYNKLGRCEKAISNYKKAINFNRQKAKAYYGLGICFKKLGEREKEINSYRQALEINPYMTRALVNLGNVYFSREDYLRAAEYYGRAVDESNQDAGLSYNLGAAYSNGEEFNKAIDAYMRALEIDPEMGKADKGLVICYYRIGEYEKAWEHIQKAQEKGEDINKDLVKAIENGLK